MPENTPNNQQVNYALNKILNSDINDINKDLLEELFANHYDRQTKTMHNAVVVPETHIRLTKDMYPFIKEPIETTLGLLFFNRFTLERNNIIQHLGYWNETLTTKNESKLCTMVNNLFVIDTIDADQLAGFLDSREFLGFAACSFLGTSVSPALITPMENVEKRKKELFEQNRERLSSDNPITRLMAANEIEKDLIKIVNENLKNDPGYDMYASGVNNMNNNYKTINVMRGAVFNEITQNFDIVEHSLMNGINKEDIPAFANSVVAGAYPSAVGTAEAGAMAKVVLATLQSIELDPDLSSDCGTKSTIPITITESNKAYVLYRNIIDNNKMIMTDLSNINNYVGKTVRMYSPQCCLNDKICAKCAGKVFHNLGITKAGLLTTEITQKLLNLKLKSKHDLSQKAGTLDKKDIFIDNNDLIKIENGNVVTKNTLKLFVPKLLESQSVFEVEASHVMCMGIVPAKFYDKTGKEILSTMMAIPAIMSFHVYSDPQETPDEYILTYEPDSIVVNVALRQSVANVEYFLNQVYLCNRKPVVPYNMMTEIMFKCLEMNKIDLNGPAETYEFLARQLCRDESGTNSFAKVYGRNPNVDQNSYKKVWYREAVHNEGPLQSILFQDISKGLNVGLAATLNGKTVRDTPLEKIIRA
jgi:hypothetical protein